MCELSAKALRGVAAIEEMLGPELARSMQEFSSKDRFGARLARLALETCYADNWSEGTLTRRERSLLLIGALVALRQPDELRNHIRLGIANGIKHDELEPILLQLVPYVGFPAAALASKAMREFLKFEPAGQ